MASAAKRLWLVGGLCIASLPALAEEWSLTPTLGWEADHSTNRVLRDDAPGSQSAAAALDLPLTRRTEMSELTLEPHARFRRFTDDVQPDADDLSLGAALQHRSERATIAFNALVADESTLTTELAETGVVDVNASRLTESAGFAWTFLHAEDRRFNVDVSIENVDYRGANTRRLFDYRYGSASIGETFIVSSRLSLTTSAFATRLDSEQRDSQSREQGASLGVGFDFTEQTSLTASLGLSRRDIDGHEQTGTTRNLSLVHHGETGQWSVTYAHQLVPYGSGVLTQRDSADLTMLRDFAARWRGVAHAGVASNRDTGYGFTFDNRTYRYADAQLSHPLTEHWSLSAVASFANANDYAVPHSVPGWTLGLRGTWIPSPHVF